MKSWSEKLDDWINHYRPVALLGLVAITVLSVAICDWATGSNLSQQLFYPKRETVADVRFWSALVYALAFALGLPVAFLIWHWRDRNARDQIENARKDINLKEFQEVQLRAAGGLEEKLPQEAREQLQIAALHQLRGFLRGDYGESFKRPAFELFCAGLGQTDVLSFGEWKDKYTPADKDLGQKYSSYVDGQLKFLDRVSQTRNKIISEEWRYIFRSGFPLRERNFSFISLPSDADLSGLDLTGCRFIRSGLERVNFAKSKLGFAIFDRAFANGAYFSNVRLFGASLVYCGLSTTTNDNLEPRTKSVDLRGADLTLANLAHSTIVGAQLQGAKLWGSKLNDAHFVGSQFDGLTEFEQNWSQFPIAKKDAIRALWLGRGAINVDETPIQSPAA